MSLTDEIEFSKKIKKMNQTTLLISGLSKDLKNHYKSWCAKRGRTMSKDIILHMKKSIKRK
jgi:peroxiredoxin